MNDRQQFASGQQGKYFDAGEKFTRQTTTDERQIIGVSLT